jgi:integrase
MSTTRDPPRTALELADRNRRIAEMKDWGYTWDEIAEEYGFSVRHAMRAASHREGCARLAAMPDGLTPHSLRRTFASLLVALGRDSAVVTRQMGHTSPQMTLGVYAAAMDWTDGERARVRALVEGTKWSETAAWPGEGRPSDRVAA